MLLIAALSALMIFGFGKFKTEISNTIDELSAFSDPRAAETNDSKAKALTITAGCFTHAPYFWITIWMVLCKDDQRPFGYRKSLKDTNK